MEVNRDRTRLVQAVVAVIATIAVMGALFASTATAQEEKAQEEKELDLKDFTVQSSTKGQTEVRLPDGSTGLVESITTVLVPRDGVTARSGCSVSYNTMYPALWGPPLFVYSSSSVTVTNCSGGLWATLVLEKVGYPWTIERDRHRQFVSNNSTASFYVSTDCQGNSYNYWQARFIGQPGALDGEYCG